VTVGNVFPVYVLDKNKGYKLQFVIRTSEYNDERKSGTELSIMKCRRD